MAVSCVAIEHGDLVSVTTAQGHSNCYTAYGMSLGRERCVGLQQLLEAGSVSAVKVMPSKASPVATHPVNKSSTKDSTQQAGKCH